MKVTVAIFSFVLAGSALADCKADLAKVDELSTKVQTAEAQRAQLSQLREAALLLMNTGKEDLCHDVVNGMEDILERQREANMMARERTQELQAMRTATPIAAATGVVRASKVIGLPVKNKTGDNLGTIEDVAIDASSGVVAYVALTHGGFLGLREKWIAVPWRELSRTADQETIVLEIAEEALNKLAGFDEDSWPQSYDPQWRKEASAGGPVKPDAPAK
jgi:outer membrane murein-binding lipoprotein Lpp/sporulation protein YlmC with PRC-barrel domain